VEETPESIYFYKEFFSELWKDICSVLSLTELNVLTLCVQGLSYKSAAEKLGMTEKSVDNAMQRARKKIRALMHDTN
jgi:RNA polymerase sporulation-specific sigma factor